MTFSVDKAICAAKTYLYKVAIETSGKGLKYVQS